MVLSGGSLFSVYKKRYQPLFFECIYFYSIFCWNNYLDRFLVTFSMKYLFTFYTNALLNFDYISFFVQILEVQCLLLFYFYAIFMLTKVEFQFTELMKGESLKEMSKTVDFPLKKKTPKATKKRLFVCFRMKICNVQLLSLLSWKWDCNPVNTGSNIDPIVLLRSVKEMKQNEEEKTRANK